MVTDSPDDLVTAKDAAAILRRSVSTVHRLNELGRLPHAFKGDGLRQPKLFRRSVCELVAAQLDAEDAA